MKLGAVADGLATALLVGVALTVLVGRASTGLNGDDVLKGWRDFADVALWHGDSDAAVVVTVFVDFQCPYCAMLQPTIDSLRSTWGPALAVAMIHYPLPSHPQATDAAVAVECASEQGAHEHYVTELFRWQDRFAFAPWTDVAQAVNIPDLAAFDRCVGRPMASFSRIIEGQHISSTNSIRGTPTLFVNGVRTPRSSLGTAIADAMPTASPRVR